MTANHSLSRVSHARRHDKAKSEDSMQLPDKFNNPIWLGLGVAILMSVFVLLLMGVGLLLS
jgi:hypothetical protein